MSHLTLESLARLVDEAAAPEEESHLLDCPRCRRELRALREQQEAMSALPRLLPPPDSWPEIRSKLHEEGLVRTVRGPRFGPAWRTAAAVLLFMAGGVSGYALRGDGATAPVRTAAEEPVSEESLPLRSSAEDVEGQLAGTQPEPDQPDALDGEDRAGPPGGNGGPAAGEDGFQLALDRFMANSPEATDPAARLAALDNILLITAEALSDAPSDPVISGYYRTAVAQRNAILRQIEATRAEPVF